MRIALHPHTFQQVKADNYSAEFGRKIADGNDKYRLPNAICETCRKDLHLVAERSARNTHFRHFDGARCPSSSRVGEPYLSLTPVAGDPEAAQRLKASFRHNWQRHYRIISDLVPFLAPEEFVNLVREATSLRIWEYRSFPEERIPYALVLVADFAPWTSRRYKGKTTRELWLRFWFGTEVERLDDLWIREVEKMRLFRASFPAPKTRRGRPKPHELLKLSTFTIDIDFLSTQTFQPLRQWEIDTVERWFAGRPDFA